METSSKQMNSEPCLGESEAESIAQSLSTPGPCEKLHKEVVLPPLPLAPEPEDCCGSGCVPCVLDIYEQEVAIWKRQCEAITRGEDKKPDEILSPELYKEFCIVDMKKESVDSWRYRFTVPGRQRIPIAVGQHLIMRWCGDEGIVTRQYTPVLTDYGYFDVVIKVYPKGKMSAYIKKWHIGDAVEWRGPCGTLSYKPNQYGKILLLAAGTGIAPMIPLIRHIVTNDEDDTMVCLLYSCRSYEELLCKEMLDNFTGYWNFSVTYFVTGTQGIGGANVKYGDKVHTSRLSRQVIEQYLSYNKVYLCGTRDFDKTMIEILKEVNYSAELIHKF